MTRAGAKPSPNAGPAGPRLAERRHIQALIAREMADHPTGSAVAAATLEAFRDALQEPRAAQVTAFGGITARGWSVTRPNGPYRVYYLPSAGVFSLCVDSVIGPLDIGVHGDAIGCYASV